LRPSIAILKTAAAGALGTDADALALSLLGDRSGVKPPRALEQRPTVEAGAGEVELASLGMGGDRAERLVGHVLTDLLRQSQSWCRASPERSMLVLGTTLAGMRHCGQALRRTDCEQRGAQTVRDLGRTPAGAVATRALRRSAPGVLRGGVISLSCACASALSAVAHACSLLRSGAADLVVAGGYDPICEFAYGGFNALQLVATGPLSPFAKDREGMKLGEGCALLALCRLEDVHDANEVVAVIDALGESSDAHHLTQPHPDGAGAARALKDVASAGLPGLLLAHATGTAGNDDAEYHAYCATFGEALPQVPVTALKSRLGHPLGAAGALELVAVLRCLERGFIPAGGGRLPDRDRYSKLDLLHGAPRVADATRVCALAAGFGGVNVAVGVSRVPSCSMSTLRSSVPGTWPTVTGVGVICSAGVGIEALTAIRDDTDPREALRHAAPLLDAARTRRVSDLAQLMLAAVEQLRRSMGAEPGWLRDTPLIAATWHGAVDFTNRYYNDLVRSGIDHANPMLFAESVPNIGSAHVSMAHGITAASSTVVGTRTAALEALALVRARFLSGAWKRALVVAADEASNHVDSVLSGWTGSAVRSEACAVAVLLGEGGQVQLHEAYVGLPGHSPLGLASGFAVDRGAAGPLALVASAVQQGGGVVEAADPWTGTSRVSLRRT
jgi:3-oxoacyl-[acyl-carrier-protein] synthase II